MVVMFSVIGIMIVVQLPKPAKTHNLSNMVVIHTNHGILMLLQRELWISYALWPTTMKITRTGLDGSQYFCQLSHM